MFVTLLPHTFDIFEAERWLVGYLLSLRRSLLLTCGTCVITHLGKHSHATGTHSTLLIIWNHSLSRISLSSPYYTWKTDSKPRLHTAQVYCGGLHPETSSSFSLCTPDWRLVWLQNETEATFRPRINTSRRWPGDLITSGQLRRPFSTPIFMPLERFSSEQLRLYFLNNIADQTVLLQLLVRWVVTICIYTLYFSQCFLNLYF